MKLDGEEIMCADEDCNSHDLVSVDTGVLCKTCGGDMYVFVNDVDDEFED